MSSQDAAGPSDNDRPRHALPPIRTYLATELALPLPPPSSHSSSSSWDSATQTWDTSEPGVPRQESSSSSEPRPPLRSRGITPPAPHPDPNRDTDVQRPGERHSYLGSEPPSQFRPTPSLSAAPQLPLATVHSSKPSQDDHVTRDASSSPDIETRDASYLPARFRWDTERRDDPRMHLDPAEPSSRAQLPLTLRPADWGDTIQDLRPRESASASATDTHIPHSRSPMSLEALLSPAPAPRRPRIRTRASTVSTRPTPRYSPTPHTRSLPPSPPVSRARTSPPQPPPSSPPRYSFNVLRVRDGELVTSTPAPRARSARHPVPVPTPSPPTSPPEPRPSPRDGGGARRHVCPACGRRFSRPSSLRTHMSVHTGERPYACPVPGCGRVFSVASNMRRHLRAHGRGGGGGRGGGEEVDTEEEGGRLQWVAGYEGPPQR